MARAREAFGQGYVSYLMSEPGYWEKQHRIHQQRAQQQQALMASMLEPKTLQGEQNKLLKAEIERLKDSLSEAQKTVAREREYKSTKVMADKYYDDVGISLTNVRGPTGDTGPAWVKAYVDNVAGDTGPAWSDRRKWHVMCDDPEHEIVSVGGARILARKSNPYGVDMARDEDDFMLIEQQKEVKLNEFLFRDE